MINESDLEHARALLAPWARETTTPDPCRLDVALAAADLPTAAAALAGARWGYLTAITGLDLGEPAGALEVLYHFCAGAALLTLRVRLPRHGSSAPSVCDSIPAASFFERELSEMLGVDVVGLPGPARLYLPDDWPDAVYPLRKDVVL